MTINTSFCDRCIHQNVCRNVDEYTKLSVEFQKTLEENFDSDILEETEYLKACFYCKNFKSKWKRPEENSPVVETPAE